MNKLTTSLLSLAILFTFSCGNNNKTDSKTSADTAKRQALADATLTSANPDDFTIDVPQGWEKQEKDMNGRKLLFLMAPKSDNFQPNLNILKDNMQGRDLAGYVEFNLQHMGNLNPKEIKQNDIDINGVKGKLLNYSTNYQGRELVIGSFILPDKDGNAYVITATALNSQYQALAPTFDKTIHSFKIK